MLKSVIKRDGRRVDYDQSRIVLAIEKAERQITSRKESCAMDSAKKVEAELVAMDLESVSIEQIQDLVISCLHEYKDTEC